MNQAQEQPAGRPLRVGVVGDGPWGRRLGARWAGAPGVDWRGAAALGGRPLQALLDEGLDLALVATEPAAHAAVARACLGAAAAVFVEKPPALDLHELSALEAAAGRPGRLAGSAVWLEVPWVQAARAHLAAAQARGVGGALRLVRHNPSAPRAGVDEIVDLAPHDLLLLHSLRGRCADSARAWREGGRICAALRWEASDEEPALTAALDLSWAAPRARGLAWAPEGGPPLEVWEGPDGLARAQGEAVAPALPGPEPLLAERDRLIHSLRRADSAGWEEAWALQRMGVAALEALRRSLALGGPEAVRPPAPPPWVPRAP